jgi:phosphotransferase system enzyme I (PtsP)
MFPFVAQMNEFDQARAEMDKAIEREIRLGHPIPESLEIGAMLETPSLAFAPKRFFETVDFVSIGGNDLKQFFFAADRENELVRRRYDTLSLSFLSFLEQISNRCAESATKLSFCGEDAGRPVEAAAFAAIGIKNLSMRPASIGPVKHILLQTNLDSVKAAIKQAHLDGAQSARTHILQALRED